jgi:hypothetical protein
MSRADPNDAARESGLTAPIGGGSVELLGSKVIMDEIATKSTYLRASPMSARMRLS